MRTRCGCIVMIDVHCRINREPFRRCPDDVQERDDVLA